MAEALKLQVVIASTRPGRVGLPVGTWFAGAAREHGKFAVEVADLAEINLPFLDEPHHPRLRKYQHQHTRDWSARVDSSDAFVFVQPEYNFALCAPLKNALDYLLHEWGQKPAGIVSYGGISAGLRAAQMSKQVFTALNMMPIAQAVSIPVVTQMIREGHFEPTEAVHKSVTPLLDELHRWAVALKALRESAR